MASRISPARPKTDWRRRQARVHLDRRCWESAHPCARLCHAAIELPGMRSPYLWYISYSGSLHHPTSFLFYLRGACTHTKSLVIVASVSIVSWALIVIHTITLKTNSPTLLDVPGSLDNHRHRRSIETSSDTPEIKTCALRSALLHAAPTSLSISSPIPSTLVLGNYHVSPPSFGPLRYAPLGQ